MKGWMRVGLVAVIAAGFAMAGGATFAQMKGNPIKERQALMKDNAKQAKTVLAPLAMGKTVSAKAAEAAARELQHNLRKFVTLFPAGTSMDDMKGKTRAKPAIWKNEKDFHEHANRLVSAAEGLMKAAADDDKAGMKAAAANVGKACAACHKAYRGPRSRM